VSRDSLGLFRDVSSLIIGQSVSTSVAKAAVAIKEAIIVKINKYFIFYPLVDLITFAISKAMPVPNAQVAN